MKRITADMGLLLVGFLWAGGFIATKIGLNEGTSPLYMITLRFIIAAVCISIIFHKYFYSLKKKEIKKFFLLGLLLFLAYWLQTLGSAYTSASKAAFYTGVNVLFVPYISWMLNRKAPDIYTYISTILCIIGIGFISYVPGIKLFQLNIGDMLVILSAIFFGMHISLTGYFAKKYRVEKMMIIQLISIAGLYTICLLFSHFILKSESIKILNRKEFWSIIYLGVISTAICISLQTLFQRYTSSVRAAIYLSTESLFAPIFAYIIINEQLSSNVYFGGFFIVLAILLSETKFGIKIFSKEKKK